MRKSLRLSQRDFADLIGATPQAVNNWEKGRQRPALDVGEQIAEATGVTLDYLYRGIPGGMSPEIQIRLRARPGDT